MRYDSVNYHSFRFFSLYKLRERHTDRELKLFALLDILIWRHSTGNRRVRLEHWREPEIYTQETYIDCRPLLIVRPAGGKSRNITELSESRREKHHGSIMAKLWKLLADSSSIIGLVLLKPTCNLTASFCGTLLEERKSRQQP